MTTPAEAVVAANAEFYAAFEAESMDRMSGIWEHSERAFCTHPGWQMLRGWPAVSESWEGIFSGPSTLQFILTNERVDVAGDVAWVSNDENLLGPGAGGTVAALNLFAHTDGAWRLVGHHASAVMRTR